jgi:hypothetical protein
MRLVIPLEWQQVHLLTPPVQHIVITPKDGHQTEHTLEHNNMYRIAKDIWMVSIIIVFSVVCLAEFIFLETYEKFFRKD